METSAIKITDSGESIPIDWAIGIPIRIRTDATNDPFKKTFLLFIISSICRIIKRQKEQ